MDGVLDKLNSSEQLAGGEADVSGSDDDVKCVVMCCCCSSAMPLAVDAHFVLLQIKWIARCNSG